MLTSWRTAAAVLSHIAIGRISGLARVQIVLLLVVVNVIIEITVGRVHVAAIVQGLIVSVHVEHIQIAGEFG